MLFQYNLYFVILSVTVIISTTIAFAAWQRRSICSASKLFISMMLAIAGYATVAAMEAAAIILRECFSQRSLCLCGLKVIYLTLLGAEDTKRRG